MESDTREKNQQTKRKTLKMNDEKNYSFCKMRKWHLDNIRVQSR